MNYSVLSTEYCTVLPSTGYTDYSEYQYSGSLRYIRFFIVHWARSEITMALQLGVPLVWQRRHDSKFFLPSPIFFNAAFKSSCECSVCAIRLRDSLCRSLQQFCFARGERQYPRRRPTTYETVRYIENWQLAAHFIFLTSLVCRRRYEKGHWDAVISDYKEIELIDEHELHQTTRNALEKTRFHLLENHLNADATWLPCHAIDLKRDGELKAHVDSVRFSGGMVAGISLLSPSIMRLRPGSEVGRNPEERFVDLLLPPLSLYVLTGVSRYEYAHELLPSGSVFESNDGTKVEVERENRISIIFRDAKQMEWGEFTFPMRRHVSAYD